MELLTSAQQHQTGTGAKTRGANGGGQKNFGGGNEEQMVRKA
jgi:hypothetical protein